jgi:hypothetical protein
MGLEPLIPVYKTGVEALEFEQMKVAQLIKDRGKLGKEKLALVAGRAQLQQSLRVATADCAAFKGLHDVAQLSLKRVARVLGNEMAAADPDAIFHLAKSRMEELQMVREQLESATTSDTVKKLERRGEVMAANHEAKEKTLLQRSEVAEAIDEQQEVIDQQRAAERGRSTWRDGVPSACGYYLATWLRGPNRIPTVSELWFNVVSGWWSSRGYLGQSRDENEPVTITGWMPLPAACPALLLPPKAEAVREEWAENTLAVYDVEHPAARPAPEEAPYLGGAWGGADTPDEQARK